MHRAIRSDHDGCGAIGIGRLAHSFNSFNPGLLVDGAGETTATDRADRTLRGVDELIDIVDGARVLCSLFEHLKQLSSGWVLAEDFGVHTLNGMDLIAAHPGSTHPDHVQSDDGVAFDGHEIWGEVVAEHCASGGHCLLSDASELVDHGATREDDPVLDLAVPADRGVDDEHDIISDTDIVTNVRVDHEKGAISNFGWCVVVGCGVDGAGFAEDAIVPDDGTCGGVTELDLCILWTESYG